MLAKQVYHTACRISYRVSNISLKGATFYDIIPLKECYETEYWLELMQRAEILPDVTNLMHNCGVIRRILISSINTAKKNSDN